jgi:RNA 2',3'-cyclic 3'-phosphodiesterase
MIRLFAALPVPDDIGEALLRRQEGVPGARWRPLEALHVTLRFFGQLREDIADDLDVALSTIASGPFDVALEGVGSFGEAEDIHAVWAGVAESAALRQLAARCESAARKAGLKAETKIYRPHVTLAYLNRPDPVRVAAWIQAHSLLKSPSWRVDSFGVYSSWRGPDGSVYRLEREYRL